MSWLTSRDPLGLAADAPLLRAYFEALDRRAAGEHPFFAPGHHGSTALTGIVADDTALAGNVDTIKLTHSWLPAAEQRAATLFGADLCRFSVGADCTRGNQALALAVGRPGKTIVVARTAHRSVLLGLALSAGRSPPGHS